MIEMLNMDCMEYMSTLPDKAFDLAIVDIPYGLGDKLTEGGTWAAKYKKSDANWDKLPPKEYFIELMRVSRNQIIWGGNYAELPPARGFVIWDKVALLDTMADCEFAWTSFGCNAKIFRHVRNTPEKRIHITQKPVALYKWLLSRYAKPGDKILDTHGGSGSICIACHDLGYDLTWMELDKDYYDAACERYRIHASQAQLFQPEPAPKPKESSLF